MKSPKEESTEEESKETKDEETKEQESSSDVPIPEEFQRQVIALIKECDDKECLSFIRDCVYRKEDELRRAEDKKDKKGNKVPSEFSTADMPA